MAQTPSLWEAIQQENMGFRLFAGHESQPKWTVPTNICINVAVSGRSTVSQGQGNAEYPCTIEEYVKAASEVIEAGACGIHVDFALVTTPDGVRLDKDIPLAEGYKRVIGPLRDKFGWGFVPNCNILTGKTFDESMSPIREGIAEVVPSAAGHPESFMMPALKTAMEYGVSPEIAVHDSGEIMLAKTRLIDTGFVKKPYNWIILYGMPFDRHRTLISGTWVPNTQDMANHLMLMVNQIKSIDPDSPITVCAAGRAGIYMTTFAAMLGLNIRVGTEDCVWKAPNSDDIYLSNLDMFEAARNVAKLLGRRPATANEYRKMIGLAEKPVARR